MKKFQQFAVSLLLAPLVFGCASQEHKASTASKPSVEMVEKSVLHAAVVGIDRPKRLITIHGPEGQTVTVEAPPEMRNFDQLKVGDVIEAIVYESMAIDVTADGEVGANVDITARRAEKGDKPGIAVLETRQISARVTAIDYDARTVTLKGPKGNSRELQVGPEVKKLNAVKVGDVVSATMTVGILISAASVR